MAHLRKRIRENIVSACTSLTTTGSNVFESRVYPLGSNKLPGVCVYTQDEASLYQTINLPRLIHRSLTVAIEIYVKAISGYDDTLDQICLEIEEALTTDVTRGGLAKDTRITSFTSAFSADGEQPACVGTLVVTVEYCTAENDPETLR